MDGAPPRAERDPPWPDTSSAIGLSSHGRGREGTDPVLPGPRWGRDQGQTEAPRCEAGRGSAAAADPLIIAI
jgi:hypothetical protein